jgi:hypothetical protein
MALIVNSAAASRMKACEVSHSWNILKWVLLSTSEELAGDDRHYACWL